MDHSLWSWGRRLGGRGCVIHSVVLVNFNFITNANKFMVFLFLLIKLYLTHTTEFYGQQNTIKPYTLRVFRNRLNTKSIMLTITYDYG